MNTKGTFKRKGRVAQPSTDGTSKQKHHQPLEQQIADENKLVPKQRTKRKNETNDDKGEDDTQQRFIEKDISKKILERAREQLGEEDDDDQSERVGNKKVKFGKPSQRSANTSNAGSEDEFSEDEEYDIPELDQITEEDENALNMWMPKAASQQLTLADIIMEKIKQSEESGKHETVEEQITSSLDPKVIDAYKKVGLLLQGYTSGKLPKAFKIVPTLNNWEEILYLTSPHQWTPAAMRAATRLFASNLNSRMAQRFYNVILLPAVRDDIAANKKLNYHYYMALKKAVYKPAAFYKGLILPLCEGGDCTLREATIYSSIIAKISIPILHSSAAILKIAEMDYSGANSMFLRVLLNKKYALPYRVVDAVVKHFAKFMDDSRRLPILWHQALLVFVQRYKNDLLADQKETIKQVIKQHSHPYFGDEIRRELANSKNRGDNDAPMQEVNLEMDL